MFEKVLNDVIARSEATKQSSLKKALQTLDCHGPLGLAMNCFLRYP